MSEETAQLITTSTPPRYGPKIFLYITNAAIVAATALVIIGDNFDREAIKIWGK
jgi:hypothetical protein